MKRTATLKSYVTKAAIIFAALLMSVQIFAVSALAAPTVKKTKYDGRGKVEVDFRGRVQYKNLKVTVKDDAGKSYVARVTERDNDELEFVIKNYKEGKTYNYSITGIKAKNEISYGRVTGTVSIPKKAKVPTVKKAVFDREDRELEIEFTSKVKFTKPTIKISNGNSTYKAWLTDLGDDDIEIQAFGLKRGVTYTYTITGVSLRGSNAVETVTGNFTVR